MSDLSPEQIAGIEEELSCFETDFQKRTGDGPLLEPERAILRTYLIWKLLYDKREAGRTNG